MTKFMCISDSHWGVESEAFNTVNYHVQQGYPQHAQDIVDALCRVAEREQVDFIVHSGDMVDKASPESIELAHQLFSGLPIPLYLCLGNHDLSDPAAKEWWPEIAPEFFPDGQLDYTVEHDDCLLHLLPNQWDFGSNDYCWSAKQDACFSDEQREFLRNALSQQTNKFHFIVTHSPVHPIDSEQVGPAVSRHGSNQQFEDYFSDLSTEHKHLRAVIGGHTHHNMYVNKHDCHFVTTSAFLEAPFDYKLFEVNNDSKMIDMKTCSLQHDVSFPVYYDHNKNCAQGRLWDRTFNEHQGQYMKKDDAEA